MKSNSMKNIWFISVVLIAMISLTFALGITAGLSGRSDAANAAWEGEGAGTKADPYLIGTKAELEKFRDIVNGINGETSKNHACARLTADIDLEGDADNQWTPIDNYGGDFDGNGHTISGLYINDSTKDNAGLFGYLGSGYVSNTYVYGAIKNLTVEGSITCKKGAGIAYSARSANVIEGCTNKVNVSADTSNGYAGGIVAENYANITDCVNDGDLLGRVAGGILARDAWSSKSTNIKNCINNGTVAGLYVGGICGTNGSVVTGCVNNGAVVCNATEANSQAGGISGGNISANDSNKALITNCVNNGTVTVIDETSSYYDNIGGIVGYTAGEGATIAYCENHGSVSYQSGTYQTIHISGIIGMINQSSVLIKSCFNDGAITGNDYVGGIGAYISGTVENCYNVGDVTGNDYVGGIVGDVHSPNCNVRNCYNTGDVVAPGSRKGMIYGHAYDSSTMTDCYYLSDGTGTGALSAAQFAEESSFNNWSFGDVWSMYTVGAETRPYLVRTYVKYYDQAGDATSYAQVKTLVGIENVFDVTLYNDTTSFGADYDTLYPWTGATHVGWATEFGGQKVYDFGDAYTDTETLDLYPAYVLAVDPVVVVSEDYNHEYDGNTHELAITVTHEYAESITYQWYKLNEVTSEYGLINNATNSTYNVMIVADSGMYKVAYKVICSNGYGFIYDSEEVSVTITKGTPSYEAPTDLNATYGQTLSDVDLTDGWTWDDATQSVGEIGEHEFSATFRHEDEANYNTVTTNLTVTVGKATPSYEAPTGLSATIGQTLSDVDLTDGWAWVDDLQELNKVGTRPYAATYTPEDTTHYSVVEIDLEVGVYHGDWTGSGNGKSNSPYVITTKAELEHFRDIVTAII